VEVHSQVKIGFFPRSGEMDAEGTQTANAHLYLL
jgi:hypothetical protein